MSCLTIGNIWSGGDAGAFVNFCKFYLKSVCFRVFYFFVFPESHWHLYRPNRFLESVAAFLSKEQKLKKNFNKAQVLYFSVFFFKIISSSYLWLIECFANFSFQTFIVEIQIFVLQNMKSESYGNQNQLLNFHA